MDREAPLSAVFVTEVFSITVPMLAEWAKKGHRIAAIVVPGPRPGKQASFSTWRRRMRRRLILTRYLGHRHPPLIEFGPLHDWAQLRPQLAALDADLLICFGLRNLIPDTVLALFPRGGLNLHPALLPHYRGPHPIHRLVIDGKHTSHGGTTLHKMTAEFDRGDILAQVPFSGEDWYSAATVATALARAMAVLVADAAPAYCRGRLDGLPQPEGDFTWAELGQEPLVVSGQWSCEYVATLCRIFGATVSVNVPVNGELVRLALAIRRLGPATGEAPTARWGMVAFDCADGRALHMAYNELSRRLMRLRRRLGHKTRAGPLPDIRKFGSKD